MKIRMAGLEQMASSFVQMLDSGDRSRLREIIKMGLSVMFGPVTASQPGELEEFVATVSEALTTEKMLKSSFFTGLRELFGSLAEGNLDGVKMANIMGLLEPMLSALIDHWIQKYDKPVITTTFTEENSRMSEGGHFAYSNAERAANVLAKLVEYREYLESAEERE